MKKSRLFFTLFSLIILGATLAAVPPVAAASSKTAVKTTAKTATKATAKTTATKAEAKPVVSGQITATSTTKVVVKSGTKTYTVNITKAKITRQSSATSTKTIAAQDLKKGETISVFGTLSKTTVTATSIVAPNDTTNKTSNQNKPVSNSTSTPAFGQGPRGNATTGTPEFGGDHATGTPDRADNNRNGLFGTVTAINDSALTVDMMSREASSTITYTVTLSSTTTYSKDQAAATISDIAVGSKVMITGTIDATAKTVTATKVEVVTKIPGQPGSATSAVAN
jgi:hypothetical protein